MRSTIIAALLGFSLLPGAAAAQTSLQTAAVESSTTMASPAPTPSSGGAVTREQYIQRAQERAAQRAAARFDQMDTNHDGVLDRAERRAWRSEHARRAAAPTPQPAAQ
jgi:hypothetical protein